MRKAEDRAARVTQRAGDLTIRRATPEDVTACARIVCDWERSTGFLSDRPGADVIAQHIAAAFPAREIWVVGDPVQGYMSLDPAECKIGAIYLTHPGQGVGKRGSDIAKDGRNHLWLTVYEPNKRAQAFYRREGFVVAERLPSDGTEPDMFRMEWRR